MDRPDPASNSTGRSPADRAGPPQDASGARHAGAFRRQLGVAGASAAPTQRAADARPQNQPFAEAAAPATGARGGPAPGGPDADVGRHLPDNTAIASRTRSRRRHQHLIAEEHSRQVRQRHGTSAQSTELPQPGFAMALRHSASATDAGQAGTAGSGLRQPDGALVGIRLGPGGAEGTQAAVAPSVPSTATVQTAHGAVTGLAVTFAGGRIRTMETLQGRVEFSHHGGLTVDSTDPRTLRRLNVSLPLAAEAFRAARPDILTRIAQRLDAALSPADRLERQDRQEQQALISWMADQMAGSQNADGIAWATQNAYPINATQDIPAPDGPYRELTIRTGGPADQPQGTLGTGAISVFRVTPQVNAAIADALTASDFQVDPRDRYRTFYSTIGMLMPSFLPFLDPPPPAPPSSPG